MPTVTVDGLEIPEGAMGFAGFREWVAALGEGAPRVHYARGRIYVEMTPQIYETHARLVQAINRVLDRLAVEGGPGLYYMPPSWITDERAELSTEPDGFLVRWASLESGRVRIHPARETEMVGHPDMALEVVSKSSAKKDLEHLVHEYARSGVREYWIADGREERVSFRILVADGAGRFREQPADEEGWIASPIWGRAFCLERFTNRAGMTDFRLRCREG